MRKYVEYLLKYKKIMISVIVLINLVSIIGIFKINLSMSFDVFTPRNSVYLDNSIKLEEDFQSTDTINLIVEFDQEQVDKHANDSFILIKNYLVETTGVKSVNGPGEENKEINFDFLNQSYQSLGDFSPIIYDQEKIYGNYRILLNSKFEKNQIKKLEIYLEESNVDFYITGDLYMQQKIFDFLVKIITLIPPTAIILILLVFNSQIRNKKGTALSVLPAALGSLWTMGIIGWSGVQVSIVTVLTPIFTIVIGSADGLHFISHTQDARVEGMDKLESIAHTLKMVGVPMIITTITSIAGFMALLAIDTAAIASLALFASVGILLAGVATWVVLPLILTNNIDISSKRKKITRRVVNLKAIWGLPSILISIALVAGSVYSFSYIKTEFNQLMVYKKNTEVYQNFDKVMEVSGGAVPVMLHATSSEDITDVKYAYKLIDLQNQLEELDSVSKTVSAYDMYAQVHQQILDLPNPEYPSKQGLVPMVEMFLGDKTKDFLTDDHHSTLMMIFPVNLENYPLDQISEMVEDFNQENDFVDLKLSGSSYLMRDLNKEMVNDQIVSSILAFTSIFFLLLLSLKKLIPAVFATIPIIMTVIVLYGFLGVSGISLNIMTATIFSITIGVGIDYAVHFTSVFMSFKKDGLSSSEAVDKAFKYTMRPITANAFGVAIGLSALFLSPLKIHTYVGMLMWVSMIASVFLSLSFLPTLLKRYQG